MYIHERSFTFIIFRYNFTTVRSYLKLLFGAIPYSLYQKFLCPVKV
jgi:hypothetical protein